MTEDTYAGDVTPTETWEALSDDPAAVLVDVRTDAEWKYVGVADLSDLDKEPVLVPWQVFPAMEPNPDFVQILRDQGLTQETPVYFLCRSGARSRSAAIAMTAAGFGHCYNIIAGFEGDTDGNNHRGTVNGWKVDRLPWRQG
jgi:rhodanese-related sulfurtransferase